MKVFILVFMALFFAACSPTSLGRFTFLSTGNVNIPSVKIKKSDVVEGKSCIHSLFGIRWGKKNDRISTAVQDAIERGNRKGKEGDFLVDAEILAKNYSFIIGHNECFVARGRVAKVEKSKE